MKSRFASLLPVFLLSSFSLFAGGCAAESNTEARQAASDSSEIVDVAHTDVERQSIGNCWLYAQATWIESMHLTATGEAFDVSQSYWTYWHWFDQISNGSSQIQTGGWHSTANEIVSTYGLMAEKDFVFADTQNEMSTRQKQALDTLNASLTSGALKDSAARRDRTKVRAEMDRAWGLSSAQTSTLDRVFGADVSRTFADGSARNAGSPVIRAEEFEVAYTTGARSASMTKTLADAVNDWQEVYYSRSDKRAFLERVQRALHDRQPVIITWFVDFNAMESRQTPLRGSFNIDTLRELGPGNQGGHMTVLEDYQAKLADGTVLKAGVTLDQNNAADRALLDRALAPSTDVQFLRVKNSWGSARPDRASAPGMPGYHDLYLNYLDGPIKQCAQVDGHTDTTNCAWDTTPLQNVVLPPGY
jgi:hypothetical protein